MTTKYESIPEVGEISEKEEGAIRVVVIDDHPPIREALSHTIMRLHDLVYAGEAESAEFALDLIAESAADVAVVDVSLGEGHGLNLVSEIRARFPNVQVVVFSMYDETAYAERAIRAGALAYVMKTAATDSVVEAIRQAASGRVYLSRRMASRILTRAVKGKVRSIGQFGIDDLTDRELSVFQMLGEGKSVEEIATTLDLSRKTVEAYRRGAKEKLGLDSIADLLRHAVIWASDRGMR
jgi:DNA-binding NarL/FixJ family response regulator